MSSIVQNFSTIIPIMLYQTVLCVMDSMFDCCTSTCDANLDELNKITKFSTVCALICISQKGASRKAEDTKNKYEVARRYTSSYRTTVRL